MKKFTTCKLALSVVLCTFMFSSCSAENTPPQINGASDELIVAVGDSINILSGVTATDAEDGDLTSQISVSSIPAMNFANGEVSPEDQGSYEIAYTVSDKKGLQAEAYATLTVTRAVGEETLYKAYEFDSGYDVDLHGFELAAQGGASAELVKANGRLELNISNSGSSPEDIKFMLPGFEVEPADYTFKFFISASGAVKCRTGEDIVELGENLSVLTTGFTADSNESRDVAVELGAFDGQISGPYSVYIEKVEIIKATGENTENVLYSNDYSSGGGEFGYNFDPSVVASEPVVTETGDAVQFEITSYGENPWEINAFQPTGINLEKEKLYYFSTDITVTEKQFYELCFEDASMDWQIRGGFLSGTLEPGTTTLTHTFNADMDVEGLYVKFALGKPEGGASSNTIIIDNMRVSELVGDKDIEKTLVRFTPFSKDTEWNTFNGTDEDLEAGVGTAFPEDGKLVYRMAEVGGADWHNKLFTTSLTLDKKALYRIEYTVSANIDGVRGVFFLNLAGKWDPRITGDLTINKEPQTFSFSTTSEFVLDTDVELLFQMGGGDNIGKQITLTFSDIKIIKMS